MIHFNYWCQDCNCGAIGKQQNFIIDKCREDEDKPSKCPNNKSKTLKLMGEQMNAVALRFSGKLTSKEDKIAALKKRASDDYKKNIHERKVEMTNKAIKNFKNL